mgnify:CR=1 FL=1
MATKDKGNKIIDATIEKEFNADSVKTQLEEKVEYHNKLAEKERELLGQLNQVRTAIAECRGSIVAYQDLIQDVPSVNGEA